MHSPQFSMPSKFPETPSDFQQATLSASDELIDAITAYTDKKRKPKRNRSAFILFSLDCRHVFKDKNIDDLNPNDKFVKIAEKWKELSEEERKVYEERAKQEKVRYTNELKDFCKIHPSEPIQRPRNHIKKPCNAYGYYLKAIKDDIRKEFPEKRMCEVLKVVAERWKNLDAQQKQEFEKKAELDRNSFKIQVNKQAQAASKPIINKVKTPSTKIEDEEDLRSPKSQMSQKQVKVDEVALEQKSRKSSGNKLTEEIEVQKRKISGGSPFHEQENVRETINQGPKVVSNSVLVGDSSTRKSSFSSISNSYNAVSAGFSNFAASPLPDNGISSGIGNVNNANNIANNANNTKFLGLLDMFLKVDLLRQNILMQLQSMSINNNQSLSFITTDQINPLTFLAQQLDPNNSENVPKVATTILQGIEKSKSEQS